jgi:hypothetical protein
MLEPLPLDHKVHNHREYFACLGCNSWIKFTWLELLGRLEGKSEDIFILFIYNLFFLLLSGAADHSSFLMLLKQLVPPLSIQLSDRRSSIVKQVLLLLTLSIVSRSAPVPLFCCPG